MDRVHYLLCYNMHPAVADNTPSTLPAHTHTHTKTPVDIWVGYAHSAYAPQYHEHLF